jgi:hypothetical protein
MFAGVSPQTSAFAVASIRTWWQREGSKRYPGKKQLLILADTGGSNPAARGTWKDHLQRFCDHSGLSLTVAHYPTGASKYNPMERRLFSRISNNWAGQPLTRYEKILKFIRTTITTTGLKVRAYPDRKNYPVGIKPSTERLRQLLLTRRNVAPKWNYTIVPSNGK